MADPSKVLAHLHDARLAHYRRHCSDDTEVLNLYVWNVDVASSLSALLGIAEVSIRHAIDTKLRGYASDIAGTTKWIEKLDELPDLMDAFNTTRRNLYKAADESRKTRPVHHPRHGVTLTHDDLVAHIMFGTWGQLLPEKFRSDRLDPQGRPVQDQDNLAARRRLWRESLHAGFPNMKDDPRGFNTVNKVRDLRRLRNRVSHMDSLLYVDIEHVHDRVLMPLLNSISFDLRDWAMDRSRVHDVLRRRP